MTTCAMCGGNPENLHPCPSCGNIVPQAYRWEIEPHPDTDEADVLVTDSDDEALAAIERAAERIWDDIEPGETRTITIKCNAVPTPASREP